MLAAHPAGSRVTPQSESADVTLLVTPQVLQQPQYRGKALPADHPDSKLVQKIAERIISAVEEGHGGGFQKHIEKFDWEVQWCHSCRHHGTVRHLHWRQMMHCHPFMATQPILELVRVA